MNKSRIGGRIDWNKRKTHKDMDRLTKEQRSKNMRAIKGKNTKPEVILRKALWEKGLRGYRKNYKGLPGNPDIVFTKYKLAIFVDGEFWHGKDWEKRKEVISYIKGKTFRLRSII